MRKLLAVLTVVTMCWICASSQGFFLIYKMSTPVKGVNDARTATIPLKAYLVLDINDSTGEVQDANLIMYGKDSDKSKVFVELDNTGDELLDIDVWEQGDYVVVNFWSYEDPFDFEGLILGKTKSKDIGLGSSEDIAGSLKGVLMVWGGILLDTSDDIAGTGNISASFWSKATIEVNENGWTQDEIVDELKDILQGQGYDEFTP